MRPRRGQPRDHLYELDDGELVRRWQHDSLADERQLAAEVVFRRHFAWLVVYFRAAGLREDAESLAGEALATALRRFDATRGSLKRLLNLQAHNLAVDEYRRRGRRLHVEVLDLTDSDRPTLVSQDPSPEEVALVKVALRNCLDGLPLAERLSLALWLASAGELTLADLSDRLADAGTDVGRSRPTASRILNRALQAAIAACLEERHVGR